MNRRTLSPKENFLRMWTRSGKPEWMPLGFEAIHMIIPDAMLERPKPDGTLDWFGCAWRFDPNCLGWAPDLHQPHIVCEDLSDWRETVVFPDLDAIDWEASAAKDLADVDRDEKIVRIFIESGPLERICHLAGQDNAFISMMEEPEEFRALADAIADYKIKLFTKIIDAYHPDEILEHDDLGSDKSPFMSVETYRQLLKPGHARMSEVIRSKGVIHTHHSCGNLSPMIGDLAQIGVNSLHPLQGSNDRRAVAAKFGKVMSFEINPDTVRQAGTTEEDIRAEVREIIDTFAPYGNFFINSFCQDVSMFWKDEIAMDEAATYGAGIYG